jgi:hypothetical protein
MPWIIRIALAVELLLVCCEDVTHGLAGYLPLGGSHVAQVAFTLGCATVIVELLEVRQRFIQDQKEIATQQSGRTAVRPR